MTTNTITRLTGDIETKRTNLNREAPVDLATLAQLLRNFDDQKRGNAVEWFATYFSNYATDSEEFLLAAGYALPERDQLLRECVHGVLLATDCCLACDCGIKQEVAR